MQENNAQTENDDYKATYSPEDNKLRLYAAYRLDDELYQRIRAAGFHWAPKQALFVAPAWSPKREDILLELCGDIGDEDTSLVDRAETRADRFEDYSEKRAKDAESAHAGVNTIVDNIPMGQPILVGHHSEKKARKDAERIEKGMAKAVKMWETSQYWTSRAAGAVRAAKYKERADVRARRIKKLEAENRKFLGYFTPCPKTKPSEYKGNVQIWCGKGRGGSWVDQSKLAGIEAYYSRYISHNNNRLAYEKAMLDEQGRSELLKPAPRPKQLPLLNYREPEGLDIENKYHMGEFIHHPQIELTKAEYKDIPSDYRGGREVGGTHRVRIASAIYMKNRPEGLSRYTYCIVFLTDSKVHPRPEIA